MNDRVTAPEANPPMACRPLNGLSPLPFDRRIVAIDLVRGLVMILMALDHTRDYFSQAGFDPLDLTRTTPALFFTRWITHFCAPLFIFLAGVSASLSLLRTGDPQGQARLLWQRGLLLIVLDLTWVRALGWTFSLELSRNAGGVLWAIGWSMIVLSSLRQRRPVTLLIAGVLLMVTHNLLDPIAPESLGSLDWLWRILHAGGSFEVGPGVRFAALYPLIPWIGLMMAGFGCGPLFLRDAPARRHWLTRWGWGLTLAFVWLRAG